jgi:hypothetical protein
MGEQPIQDPRIAEAIEACRPGSDDLSDPALAFLAAQLAANPDLAGLFERVQGLDTTLAEAFRDVPVPNGLADRIAARLAAEREAQAAPADGEQATETEAAEPTPEVSRAGRRVSRRWLLAGVGSVAVVAASITVAVLVLGQKAPALDAAAVCEEAMRLFESDWDEPGESVVQNAPPGGYPPSPDLGVLRFPEMRWRWARDFLGHRAVAYDLTRPGSPRATLYVVRCNVPGVPALPPPRPAFTTGNRSTAAWQTDGLLYVLVVEGGRETYRDLLPQRTWT